MKKDEAEKVFRLCLLALSGAILLLPVSDALQRFVGVGVIDECNDEGERRKMHG